MNVTEKSLNSYCHNVQNRPFVNNDILKNIYYSLVYSHLVYGIHVWGTACDTELNKILILQKRVVRLITFNDEIPINAGPFIHSEPLFAKLAFLKIKDNIHIADS